MTESKLQHELIMWFSAKWPDEQNRLFMIQNNTYSASHGKNMKSLGMKRGAPDLMLIGKDMVAGIELKSPGSKHKKAHILEQLDFGQSMIDMGHQYIISSNIKTIKLFIEKIMTDKKLESHMIMRLELKLLQNNLERSGSVVEF